MSLSNEGRRSFVKNLMAACNSHDQWLVIMRFGLGSLLEDQSLLMECISAEAKAICDRSNAAEGSEPRFPWEVVGPIMQELGLKVVATPTA